MTAADAGAVPVGEIVAELQCVMREPDRPRRDGVVGLAVELLRSNLAQWQLEDLVRAPDGDDATIADAKRAIDDLNASRHRLVESIDAAFDGAMTQVPSATPTTESPGMVLDRLSVLVIRLHHTELAAASSRPDADAYAVREPILSRQLAVLEEALGALLDDVRAGRRRFVPYESLKLYVPPAGS